MARSDHACWSISFLCCGSGVSSAYPDISGKLNLVDLAGSERVKKSLVVRDRLAEACAINKYGRCQFPRALVSPPSIALTHTCSHPRETFVITDGNEGCVCVCVGGGCV